MSITFTKKENEFVQIAVGPNAVKYKTNETGTNLATIINQAITDLSENTPELRACIMLDPSIDYEVDDSIIIKKAIGINGNGALIKLKNNTNKSVITTYNFNNESYTATDWTSAGSFTISNLRIDANIVNQAVTSSAELNQKIACIKLCAYGFTLENLELWNGEIGLYTEHTINWGDAFNRYARGEATIRDIYCQNYELYGWVHRGPHDSNAINVKCKSYKPSVFAHISIEFDSTKNFGGHGLQGFDLHGWGLATSAIDGGNATLPNYRAGIELIAQGASKPSIWLTNCFAEGSKGSAFYINGNKCNLTNCQVSYAGVGVEVNGNDNYIEIVNVEAITDSSIKVGAQSEGNTFNVYGNVAPVVFDVDSYAGTLGNTYNGTSYIDPATTVLFSDVTKLAGYNRDLINYKNTFWNTPKIETDKTIFLTASTLPTGANLARINTGDNYILTANDGANIAGVYIKNINGDLIKIA